MHVQRCVGQLAVGQSSVLRKKTRMLTKACTCVRQLQLSIGNLSAGLPDAFRAHVRKLCGLEAHLGSALLRQRALGVRQLAPEPAALGTRLVQLRGTGAPLRRDQQQMDQVHVLRRGHTHMTKAWRCAWQLQLSVRSLSACMFKACRAQHSPELRWLEAHLCIALLRLLALRLRQRAPELAVLCVRLAQLRGIGAPLRRDQQSAPRWLGVARSAVVIACPCCIASTVTGSRTPVLPCVRFCGTGKGARAPCPPPRAGALRNPPFRAWSCVGGPSERI